MKPIAILACLLCCYASGNAQIWKRIGRSAKEQVDNRIDYKINKTIDRGLDSLTKKKPKKQKEANDAPATKQPANPTPAAAQPAAGAEAKGNANVADPTEGFIEIKLSATTVFMGYLLTISGQSGNYGNANKIDMHITGPGINSTYVVALDKDGKFNTQWYAKGDPGACKITCTSSDKKTSNSASFTLEYLDELDEMATENIELTAQALAAVKKKVNEAKGDLSSKHNGQLDKELAALSTKTEQLKTMFGKINQAGKTFANAAKGGAAFPQNMARHISELNDALHTHKEQTQKVLEDIGHTTTGYTICETLEMVNEACAAFSTATNFIGDFKGIAKNLALDKVVPTGATALNEYAFDKKMPNDAVVPGVKLLTSAAVDGEGLLRGSGPMGLVGDLTQLVSNQLMNAYCGSFQGSVQHDFKIFHRNSKGQVWWSYGYTTQSVLTLRYPKSKGVGKVVHMKGHIEGNATKFDFFQNMQVEDEYDRISKGRAPLKALLTQKPLALPFASSAADKAGFGMMARAAATPSYFNIPVDATYDRDAGTIRLFLTEGGMDFTPLVKFRVLFVMPLVLPIFKLQEYPIEKAKATMNSVIKRYGEYKVNEDKSGNLSFSGKGTHQSGTKTSELELTVNLSLEAKQ